MVHTDPVRNLRDGLRLHPNTFPDTLQANKNWLSEGVEGPNIANVFKRTFYQMMFKFQLGKHPRCAGCVLAIPQSVWDSWQKHLGAPLVTSEAVELLASSLQESRVPILYQPGSMYSIQMPRQTKRPRQ